MIRMLGVFLSILAVVVVIVLTLIVVTRDTIEDVARRKEEGKWGK